jgi:small-conductance mechanosensitive channel
VKELVEKTINDMHLEGVDPEKAIFVRVYELGDSSVNFKLFAWVEPLMRSPLTSQVLAAIYNVLNENNIEIPFPQRDVHVIQG